MKVVGVRKRGLEDWEGEAEGKEGNLLEMASVSIGG